MPLEIAPLPQKGGPVGFTLGALMVHVGLFGPAFFWAYAAPQYWSWLHHPLCFALVGFSIGWLWAIWVIVANHWTEIERTKKFEMSIGKRKIPFKFIRIPLYFASCFGMGASLGAAITHPISGWVALSGVLSFIISFAFFFRYLEFKLGEEDQKETSIGAGIVFLILFTACMYPGILLGLHFAKGLAWHSYIGWLCGIIVGLLIGAIMNKSASADEKLLKKKMEFFQQFTKPESEIQQLLKAEFDHLVDTYALECRNDVIVQLRVTSGDKEVRVVIDDGDLLNAIDEAKSQLLSY